MTLGKGLGGGVPLAALCAKEAVSVFEPGEQGGTFNGSPLMTAVGCAVMEEMLKPGFLDSVADTGDCLGAECGARRRLRARWPREASRLGERGPPAERSPARRTALHAWRSTSRATRSTG